MPAKFEIYKDKKQEFRFRLKATNGETIATSEGYSTLQNCKKGIASVKKNAPVAVIINTAANIDLIKSADKGDLAGVTQAIKNGADVNFKDNEGETALIEAVESGKIDIVKLLIKKGAKINLQDDEGETALHEAIEEGNIEIAKFLIKSGARTNIKNKKNQTVRMMAQQKDIESKIF